MGQKSIQESIKSFIAASGAVRAKEVCKALDISQSTFSRAVKDIGAVTRIGRSVGTLYGIKHEISGIGHSFPIYTVDLDGAVARVATLHSIQPNGFMVESESDQVRSGIFEDLPFYLHDSRPSGFLGRLIPRRYPHLDFPEDVRLWSAHTCLRYAGLLGWDLIGNFIIGEKAYQLYHSMQDSLEHLVPEDSIVATYDRLARETLELGAAGSSAGGEQPKFLAVRALDRQPVLVKFSPAATDPVAIRRKDLLIAEHLSHCVLGEAISGASAQSRLFTAGNRTYLELERFDRIGRNGRRGVVSLATLDSEFVGSLGDWRTVSRELVQRGVISNETYQRVLWRYYYGHLIANTDMHAWNLSFFCSGDQVGDLTPVYDMLPMLYAPSHDQIVEKTFRPIRPFPEDEGIWEYAREPARLFWSRCSDHAEISREFRSLAAENSKIVSSI